MKNLIIFSLFTTLLSFGQLKGQACCTAGTPLMSSLDVSTTPVGIWQLSLNYHYNFLNDVLAGTEKLEGFRQRLSQAAILDISYGINRSWSVTLLMSYLQQSRKLNQSNSFGSNEELTTRGPGDALILAKYTIVKLDLLNQQQFAVGFGIKAPLGESTLKQNGFLLPADLQPGTGSWDVVIWAYWFEGFLPQTRFNYFINTTYRMNGRNDRYQNSELSGYRFGNEFVTTLGFSYGMEKLLGFTVLGRYRFATQDELGTIRVANTGGMWLDIVPGVNLNIDPLTFRLSAQLPVYRNVEGIQLTTSYALNLALFYSFGG